MGEATQPGCAMTGPEIVRFIKRNAYRPDLVTGHWHQRGGQPTDFAICVANPMKGFSYRVGLGDLPEHTLEDPASGKILLRGWRGLFKQMLCDGVIMESKEVVQKLGHAEINHIKNINRGFKINVKAHELA